MKAAVLRAFGEPLVIEDLILDPPQDREVRVRIGAVAICGSDLHANSGAWGGELPMVTGHEAAGIVAAVGPGVVSVTPGDHVVVSLLRECGACYYCRHDQSHICEMATPQRLRDAAGGRVAAGIYVGAFAEEVVVHESQVVAIPDEVPLDCASLLACGVITGYGAVVNTAAVPAGSSVVVIGCGGVGINCVQGARAAGADPIVAIDAAPTKLDLAGRLGATDVLVADDPALPDRVRDLTGGRGADYVFVAVGNPRVVESGIESTRPGGTVVVVGISGEGERARVDTSEFASVGLRLIGSKMGSARLARDVPHLAAEYLAGRLHLDELISGRFDLAGINDAIAGVQTGAALRNVVVFDGVGR